MKGCLYVVGLPIGNAQDLTPRAKEVLQTVDFILAEDTRKFRSNCRYFGIHTLAKVFAYHSHNEMQSAKEIIKFLLEGNKVALVSDAGSPAISDPGRILIDQCYTSQIPVIPIPGPSAFSTLMSISPFPSTPSLFLGFLSTKQGKKKKELEKYQNFQGSIFIFESVHRMEKTLLLLLELWGNLPIFIGREMTKTHEEYFLGDIEAALSWLPEKRGEFSFVIFKT
ncbi:MAG: 16S rRNA (cytidine(1402)-2'-O)-methyltransferase [Candidatus Hydrogenedentota bacterium]|nr:MAG: 16S rRNA (cytidine(1402)-2'-O)-methyltransferase [Candidatus Hydrogenedentota bacterium]